VLPASLAWPTAVVFAAGGLLACFFGYRLFRIVLGIYGFILGAMVTTSLIGEAGTWTLVLAIVVGGLVGAVLMIVAYFLGVGLIGAGLAVLALHWIWLIVGGDPPNWVVVLTAVLGALLALNVQRYVVIFGTALAGAWTLLIGGMAVAGNPTAARAAEAGEIWVVYPFGPADGPWWMLPAWLALAFAGALVQLATTKGKPAARKKT
jgi:hypothetical protein